MSVILDTIEAHLSTGVGCRCKNWRPDTTRRPFEPRAQHREHVAEQLEAIQQWYLTLLAHLAETYTKPDGDHIGDDCTLVGLSGSGRCIEQAVALQWKDGFIDLICAQHAEAATMRGVIVIYPSDRARGATP